MEHFQRPQIPKLNLLAANNIKFLHPHYSWKNILLSLPRVDQNPAGKLGVHHQTALIGCQIVANNVFDRSYLSLDKEGIQRVDRTIGSDEVLTDNEYYLIVPDVDAPYPVVPSFSDWQFPHGGIPSSWPEVEPSTGVSEPFQRCGVTKYSFAIESAHLVPKEEATWFNLNSMDFTLGQYATINTSANLLPLRADVHKIFDKRWWAIVPKIGPDGGAPKYVSHILHAQAGEVFPEHHNVEVQYLHQLSRPYLFARFAWAVLISTKWFVTSGMGRKVVRLQAASDDTPTWLTMSLPGEQLKSLYLAGGSRSATPQKKRRTTDTPAEEEMESSDSSCSDDDEDVWDALQRRNRRLQQTSSSTETAPDVGTTLKSVGEAVAPVEEEEMVSGLGA
ncbi:hypothetical protein EMCG_03998 [[Emmonsia] crescens]|uniref:HNH nuclease domain-containing protein n=1 Tax=[Emmonsia] crescens TaxID=73230 RepID=A0A0G2HTE1_9EURO|nr:hypothetical protein EMCG_03998 [Emmonsia crescens UAMH 3008]